MTDKRKNKRSVKTQSTYSVRIGYEATVTVVYDVNPRVVLGSESKSLLISADRHLYC